jgi:hypothetical protein
VLAALIAVLLAARWPRAARAPRPSAWPPLAPSSGSGDVVWSGGPLRADPDPEHPQPKPEATADRPVPERPAPG